MKRGIDVNRSTVRFLELIRPNVDKVATRLYRRIKEPFETVRAEVEARAVEVILTSYEIGEKAPPTVFLFRPKVGGVTTWAADRRRAAARRRKRLLSYDEGYLTQDIEARLRGLNKIASRHLVNSGPPSTEMSDAAAEDPPPASAGLRAAEQALSFVEDGKTLNATEYRVLRFCLAQASGTVSVRRMSGLHLYLARVMETSAERVSQRYASACRALIQATGLRHHYLQAKGLSAAPERAGKKNRLTPELIVHALEQTARAEAFGGATYNDVAFACGITDESLRRLRRRYAGMPPAAVRALLDV